MPFNNTTKRFDRVWQFVTQFLAGDDAQRTDFDISFNDVRDSLNQAIAYLEGRDNALAVSATDLRYIGTFASQPTTRVGGGAFQSGDFYFNSTSLDFRVFDGAVFGTATGLPTVSAFVRTLLGAIDQPTLRGLIGLGTAAVQNSTFFATAAQGVKADAAVQAPSGLANTVTDWQSVHASGTGPYQGAAGAANAPVAAACAGHYVKNSATTGVLTVADMTGRKFQSVFTASAIGAWREVVNTPLGSGLWSVASSVEAIAGILATRLITPSVLPAWWDDHFTLSMGADGYIAFKIQTNLIKLQWVSYSLAAPGGSTVTVAWPSPFATACRLAVPMCFGASVQQIGLAGPLDRFNVQVIKGAGDTSAHTGLVFGLGY